jgi:hypothetical protein
MIGPKFPIADIGPKAIAGKLNKPDLSCAVKA